MPNLQLLCVDQTSPKSCRVLGTIRAYLYVVGNRSFDTTSFELPYLSAFFTGRVPDLYAAALLVRFIVLVIVAFVYVIMNEDDKDDQHKH